MHTLSFAGCSRNNSVWRQMLSVMMKIKLMGIPTLRYKLVGWSVAAFFMGCTGAVFGNMVGYIEPLEVAVATFGIFMVAMSLLGGKGTLWGPVLGTILFHIVKETTWTYFLVCSGCAWPDLNYQHRLFSAGIMGWLQSNILKSSVFLSIPR